MKLYEVQEKVNINKKIFDDLTNIHNTKITIDHASECTPNQDECSQCWEHKCDNCRHGFNDRNGKCNNTLCFDFMRKKLYMAEFCIDKKNIREITLTHKSLYLKDEDQLQYHLDSIVNKPKLQIVFIRDV